MQLPQLSRLIGIPEKKTGVLLVEYFPMELWRTFVHSILEQCPYNLTLDHSNIYYFKSIIVHKNLGNSKCSL